MDGLKSNLSVWAGQCAISDVGKHEAFWLVDLSSTYSIHHITIYYRTENVFWGKGIPCIYYKQFAQLKVSKFQNMKIYLRNFHKKTFCESKYPIDFSSPELKAQVSFPDHLSSVSIRL